ncbi:hypothetical protein [Kitasatospora sp. NPDC059827]|uniref:hypothetical protein n=1 Tax=Kitasatospora sp. NPDC059827 TaxID=3346964 RepID=UPI003651E4CC
MYIFPRPVSDWRAVFRGAGEPSGEDGQQVVGQAPVQSQLSWLIGRKGIRPEGGPLTVPAAVEWTHLYTSKDFVTGYAGLSRLTTGIADNEVKSGSFRSSHDVHRYLDTSAVASLIVKSSVA